METMFNNNISINHSKAIQTKFRILNNKANIITLLIRIKYIQAQLHLHHNSKATKVLTSPITLTIHCLHKMKYNTPLISQDHPQEDLIIQEQAQPTHQEDLPIHQENPTISQDLILFCRTENDWID